MMVHVKAQVFLRDGLEVTWAKGQEAVVTKGRLNTPDHLLDVGYAVSAVDYELMYETESLKSMIKGDRLTIGTNQYSVNDIGPLWDGTFSLARLRKL